MSWSPNQTATAGSQKIKQIDWLKIGVATPDTILQSSFGEVEHDRALHHRSHLPMNHGLFCERIFGPLYDWQCPCGASNGLKNPAQRGTVCNKCGVPILHSERGASEWVTSPWPFRLPTYCFGEKCPSFKSALTSPSPR